MIIIMSILIHYGNPVREPTHIKGCQRVLKPAHIDYFWVAIPARSCFTVSIQLATQYIVGTYQVVDHQSWTNFSGSSSMLNFCRCTNVYPEEQTTTCAFSMSNLVCWSYHLKFGSESTNIGRKHQQTGICHNPNT